MNSQLREVLSQSDWQPDFFDDRSDLSSTDEILAATAHELRLPLSHIKGFITGLRRTDVEWDEETRSELMAEIDLETDRLADLVEELLAPRSVGAHARRRWCSLTRRLSYRVHCTESAV